MNVLLPSVHPHGICRHPLGAPITAHHDLWLRLQVLEEAPPCIKTLHPCSVTFEWALAWNASLPKDEEPTQPLTSLLICMETSFPVSGSICAPLLCLSVCTIGPWAYSQISVFQTPQGRMGPSTNVQLPLLGCVSCWAFTSYEGPVHMTAADLFPCEQTIIPSSVFSLATLIPRCSGHFA